MPIKREDKIKLADLYGGFLEKSAGLILFDYRGITVEQITKLRTEIRKNGGTMRVVRNRMLKRAIAGKPYAQKMDSLLAGPNCVIFTGEDPVAPTKALVDFAKGNDKIQIRGGMVNDQFMTAAQVDILSKIPPMEHLQSMILGGIKAPASKVLGGIKGLHNKIHGLMKAYCDKMETAA